MIPRVILFFAGTLSLSCSVSQHGYRYSASPSGNLVIQEPSDTTKKTTGKIKPYNQVITSKVFTTRGLFSVHKLEDRYYFEIPDSALNRDLLVVNRISKAAADNRPYDGYFGYAGDEIGESIVQFCKGPNSKVFIKRISYTDMAKDSSANGMLRSVSNSNLQPIVAAFDIKAYSPDSSNVVIDFTDYMNTDNDVLFFDQPTKKTFGLGAIQNDKSFISTVRTFPLNIEISTVKTFIKGETVATYELNSSFVMLPTKPMTARLGDDRVGYFTSMYNNFDAPAGMKKAFVINRWRLEPKEEDMEKYRKGELVEPQKPIVFYIDPATPQKWIPYLIQGVNDWQKAFEKAGFKKAIYALEAPANDSNWSLEDARHNAIIYKSSGFQNAYGPQVHDPRTGEILESHIQWFHNVMEILHDWYFIQASPNDCRARKMQFDDELMGSLIRYVCSHEVGHTLGLMHNFGASSTVPVDSLRSREYLAKNGHSPSIMDYARFNYVAQPEDNIRIQDLIPKIGVYDEWAIEWGYTWRPAFKTQEDEKSYMNNLIIAKLNSNKRLWFATAPVTGSYDPRVQQEDLGDDAIKAGYYGIRNLIRVMDHLLEWTNHPGSDYAEVQKIQKQIFEQYFRYLQLVSMDVGGVFKNSITREQKGKVYDFPDKEKQKAAVKFLENELFVTPHWLLDKKLFPFTSLGNYSNLLSLQKQILFNVLSRTNFKLMSFFEEKYPGKVYRYKDLLDDMKSGIWRELYTNMPIEQTRRNLQKAYAERLISLLHFEQPAGAGAFLQQREEIETDFTSLVKDQVRALSKDIDRSLLKQKDQLSRLHLIDVKERLLNYLRQSPLGTLSSNDSGNETGLFDSMKSYFKDENNRSQNCWDPGLIWELKQ
jgi:hypothetical protein